MSQCQNVSLVQPKRMMNLLCWEKNRDAICDAIRKKESFLKIILKTRDDPVLLERWIKHHASIVSEENIIILDNVSVDSSVIKSYRDHSGILSFQFSGYHNYVHDSRYYPEFYAALKASCTYYIFLDTDEFVTWVHGDQFYNGADVLHCIKEYSNGRCYAGTWLRNLIGYDDRFYAFSKEYLMDGLLWGKPLIAAQVDIACPLVIHNEHLISANVISANTPPQLFILHLNRLDPLQRIRVNLYKLRVYGVYVGEEDLGELLATDTSLIEDQNQRIYTNEIQTLAQLPLGFKEELGMSVRFCEDGSLQFSDERTKLIFSSFLQDGRTSKRLF